MTAEVKHLFTYPNCLALTTAFIFISTWKWIGKSSFCKLYGFFFYLLYYEAIFGNLNGKTYTTLFYISNTIFYISTWGWAGKFKRSASNPSPAPRGVQSMTNLSGDHPGAKTFQTTPHMTLSWFLIPLFP